MLTILIISAIAVLLWLWIVMLNEHNDIAILIFSFYIQLLVLFLIAKLGGVL
jgi:hypothetical protein